MKTSIFKIALALLIIVNAIVAGTAKIDINNTDILERWDGQVPFTINGEDIGPVKTGPINRDILERWDRKISTFRYLDETELGNMPVEDPQRLNMKHKMISDDSARAVIASMIGIAMLLVAYLRLKGKC